MRGAIIFVILVNLLVTVISKNNNTPGRSDNTAAAAAAAAAASSGSNKDGGSSSAAAAAAASSTVIKSTQVNNGNGTTTNVTRISTTAVAAAAAASSSNDRSSAGAGAGAGSADRNSEKMNKNTKDNGMSQTTEDNSTNCCCSDTEITTKQQYDCSDENALTRFKKAIFSYSASFLNSLIQNNPMKTVNGSPLMSLLKLALEGLYAEREMLKQILKALNLERKDQIPCVVLPINQYLRDLGKNQFTWDENFIFLSRKFPFTNDFKQTVKTIFKVNAINEDFSNNTKAVANMNERIEDTTGLCDVIPSNVTFDNDDAQLYFATPLYFKPYFKIGLHGDNIKLNYFYNTRNDKVYVPYYHQQEAYYYTKDKSMGITAVKIELDGDADIILIMPDRKTRLKTLIPNLLHPRRWALLIKSMKLSNVTVAFPTFRVVHTNIDSTNIANKSLGFDITHNPRKADFSYIAENVKEKNKRIYVTGSVQLCEVANDGDGGSSPGIPKGLKKVQAIFQRPHLYFFTVRKIPVICGIRYVTKNDSTDPICN